MDREHVTYWLTVHGFVNSYWCVWEEKPAKIIIQKGRPQVKKTLSGYSHGYIPVSFSVYVCTHVATKY